MRQGQQSVVTLSPHRAAPSMETIERIRKGHAVTQCGLMLRYQLIKWCQRGSRTGASRASACVWKTGFAEHTELQLPTAK